jgi:hypothetical protein
LRYDQSHEKFRALLDYTSMLANDTKVSSLPFSLGDHSRTDISGKCDSLDISRLGVELPSSRELSGEYVSMSKNSISELVMGPAVVKSMPSSDQISAQLSRGAGLLEVVSMMREDGRAESEKERRYCELAEQEDRAALLYFARSQATHRFPATPAYEAVLLLCDDQLRIDCFVYEAIIPCAARRNCRIRAG